MSRHVRNRILEILGLVLLIALAFVGSFFLADYVRDNGTARALVEHFGYVGILAISIITGLNLFVPIPAATFAPIYASAGFPLLAIIAALVAGTVIADTIGYLIGLGGRRIATHAHPVLQEKMQRFTEQHHRLVLPLVFLYAAFSPLPNEVILIPLAITGIRYRLLFLPLLFGTILYETLFVYGITSAFHYFF